MANEQFNFRTDKPVLERASTAAKMKAGTTLAPSRRHACAN